MCLLSLDILNPILHRLYLSHSFDLGINLGEDILIGSGNEECVGNDIILNTQIDDSLDEIIFNWYKDGAILDDENSSTLVVSET